MRTGTPSATRLDIEKMGLWVTDLLSDAQLAAAAERYHASNPQNKQFLVPFMTLRQVWTNHFNKCIRMPAGGALAGGSMQTGFEVELITHSAAHALMEGWPNRQEMAHGGLSWEVRSLLPTCPTPSISNHAHVCVWSMRMRELPSEAGVRRPCAQCLPVCGHHPITSHRSPPPPLHCKVRTMEEIGPLLSFEKEPAGWGMLNGKPIAPLPGTQGHRGVLMASPPLTVTWSARTDKLVVRFPITIWSEDDSMILPPDDKDGTPFYQDPTDQPGFHRDIFKK